MTPILGYIIQALTVAVCVALAGWIYNMGLKVEAISVRQGVVLEVIKNSVTIPTCKIISDNYMDRTRDLHDRLMRIEDKLDKLFMEISHGKE